MNSDHSVQHTAKFQFDRFESENGTIAILEDDQYQIDNFQKYFNYSDPPNMPASMFQTHFSPLVGNISDKYFGNCQSGIDHLLILQWFHFRIQTCQTEI